MTPRRKTLLGILTRERLLDLARAFEVAGVSNKPKAKIINALASRRSIKTRELLDQFYRDELKDACLAAGLDDGGARKSLLVDRLVDRDAKPKTPAKKTSRRRSKSTGGAETRESGSTSGSKTMAKKSKKRDIEQYDHPDKMRVNNPPVGLVTPKTDPYAGKKEYQYDPHLDPQLVWAGKAEHTSFEVPTRSLHVHERIDPRSIIEAVRRTGGNGRLEQQSLFASEEENPPIREAIEFYKHAHGWSNRLIAGDSLLVMNSLLEKEGLAGKVQMVYIDPPYGIRYGSNFQPFVNRRDVKDGKDEDLTQEPEMIHAFRDTWELGIHSYLTYLRDRLLLARELLHESGSCFVQISDENLHRVRDLLDEVFGGQNFVGQICFQKTPGQSASFVSSAFDYLLWYGRERQKTKYRPLYREKLPGEAGAVEYNKLELCDGTIRSATVEELEDHSIMPEGARLFSTYSLFSAGGAKEGLKLFEFQGGGSTIRIPCPTGYHFKTSKDGLTRWVLSNRILPRMGQRILKRYLDDFPYSELTNYWADTRGEPSMTYVVQTAGKVIKRCLLMTTDPGDLVLDPTCGSGTTAYVAEQWGRRWMTCDTSRVAVTLAKQRLMATAFDYYKLAHPDEGVGSGFIYKKVPHVSLKSIANNPEIREGMHREEIDEAIRKYADEEVLYDQPQIDRSKVRVTGPFTVEAVPAAAVRSVDEMSDPSRDREGVVTAPLADARGSVSADASVARSGETLRQSEWRDELLKCGIRGKSGERLEFSRLEPLGGTRWLQCEGETRPSPGDPPPGRPHPDPLPEGEGGGAGPQHVVVSFGPEHAPLEQRQVSLALEEAESLRPKPAIVAFAAFQFDPEAAKDIDETKWPGVTLLKVQMNTDLLTEDLKKKRASNDSFWLIGQPDVEVRRIAKGEDKGKYAVEVRGFDYYNPRSGAIESGDTAKIAMWMLDTDYDGRSLFPRQVFFPMAGPKDGWARLARTLKAEIDAERIEAYRGTASLPFEPGDYKRVAVKIVDDRGIESLKIVELDG